jgi:cell division protein FtsW (lipid II flippase)
VNFFFPVGTSSKDQIQSRLLLLATVFLVLYSVTLSLSPAVRLHTWKVDFLWQHWVGLVVWLAGFSFIHRLTIKHLPDRDAYIVPLVGILSGLGLLTIWRLDNGFGLRQTLWIALGSLIFAGIVIRSNAILLLRRYKYLWLTGGLFLTALTFIFGTYPGGNGPHLWLGCCGVYLQPSEPLKLLLITYLAAYLADRSIIRFRFASLLLPTLILTGIALVILVAQRDLGTATLFIVLYSMVIYLASGKKRLLVISTVLILLGVLVGYRLFSVIQIRMDAWLNPWIDPNGHAYQIIQSLIAIATGGTFGNGPGIGNPAVVPVAHSDFIFAAISEELGLTGTIALIIILGLIAVRGLIIALRASNSYQRFLAAGITFNMVAQSILIIGGNLRLFPLTGVTLPFVSYGGSSLVTSFISIALLALISNHSDDETAPVLESNPFLVTGGLLLSGLLAIGTINIYWVMIRGDELQNRLDNPRWAVTERFVPRGSILDRNNQPIAVTTGVPGNFKREVLHPPLGPVIGYSNPLYGQAGLEKFLDPYLRGLQGNPTSTIVYNQIFFGQTPPGLDVRLSLDLRLQQEADTLLTGQSGALVLLNSKTGEIYAMASHPGFDPNLLAQNWSEWINDKQGVFLNRATQGQYSPGTALGPFLLEAVTDLKEQYVLPETPSLVFDGAIWNCALPVSDKPTWSELLTHGCPGGVNELAQYLSADQLIALFHKLELDSAPQISLPVAPVINYQSQDSSERLALGEGKMMVSPLQMALAISALSTNGAIPTPRIAMAVNTPLENWVVMPGAQPAENLRLGSRTSTIQTLQMENLPAWQVTATAQSVNGKITWFLAGTSPEWQGSPLSLALVLEKDDPATAKKIGDEILQTMLMP